MTGVGRNFTFVPPGALPSTASFTSTIGFVSFLFYFFSVLRILDLIAVVT